MFCSGENIGEGEDLMVVPFPKNDHRFRTTMGEEGGRRLISTIARWGRFIDGGAAKRKENVVIRHKI